MATVMDFFLVVEGSNEREEDIGGGLTNLKLIIPLYSFFQLLLLSFPKLASLRT